MKISKSILLPVIVTSLAGFLFGFDTIVISGADIPIQKLWKTGDFFHGFFIMSMALWGTVFGALLGSIPTDKLGRRKTLFWIGIFYLVSALGSALAPDPYIFSFFRFIGGLGVGASAVAAPIYISEITPAGNRGGLVAMYQFNIVFGILIAYFSNYLLGEYIQVSAWRWMLGVEAIPAAIYALFVLWVPESPRWLAVKQKDETAARKILKRLNPQENINHLLEQIKSSVNTGSKANFFRKKYGFVMLLAFLVAFFNQFSGINFVLYYAPRIFEQAGFAQSEVLGASVPIGITLVIFTLLGMYLIDKIGRKKLLLYGSIGYIFSLSAVSLAFFSGSEGSLFVFFIVLFIAAHGVGQGTVIWVYISEIFPNQVRDYGMSLGAGTHWICAAFITLITPAVLNTYSGGAIFAFFAGMMVLQLIFVITIMPETKNKSLEELEQELFPVKAER